MSALEFPERPGLPLAGQFWKLQAGGGAYALQGLEICSNRRALPAEIQRWAFLA